MHAPTPTPRLVLAGLAPVLLLPPAGPPLAAQPPHPHQANSQLWAFAGPAPAAGMLAVAGLGDLDGDGRGEVAVGAPGKGAGGSLPGLVRVVSGRTGTDLWTASGAAGGDAMGFEVMRAPDLSGDGVADVLVSAPQHHTGAGGYVELRSGRDGSLLRTHAGSAGDGFGVALAVLGDVDRDGVADYAIGAYQKRNGGPGYVTVVSGASGTTVRTHRGDENGDLFSRVAALGDVDGDGVPDLLVGADQLNNGGVGYLRMLSGRDGSTLRTVPGEPKPGRLGVSVAGPGDLNGDGVPDLLAGAWTASPNGKYSGYVRALDGSTGGRLWTVPGFRAHDLLGHSVAGIGQDWTGDGIPEVLAGASQRTSGPNVGTGYALVLDGASGSVLSAWWGQGLGDRFGIRVRGVGDVDGDGVNELAFGASRHDNQRGTEAGAVFVHRRDVLPLTTDAHLLPVASGGEQRFRLLAGPARAGETYVLLGSATGTAPGLPLGSLTLPLVPDAYTMLTASSAGAPPFAGTIGALDGNGEAAATLALRFPLPPGLVGLTLWHAFVTVDAAGRPTSTSNPVPLTFVP